MWNNKVLENFFTLKIVIRKQYPKILCFFLRSEPELEEEKTNRELKGVEDEEALRKLFNSDEEEEEEENKEEEEKEQEEKKEEQQKTKSKKKEGKGK